VKAFISVLILLICSIAVAQTAAERDEKVKALVSRLARALANPSYSDLNDAVEALLPYKGDAVLAICGYAKALDDEKMLDVHKDVRLVNLAAGMKRLLADNVAFLKTIAESESENLRVLVTLTTGSHPKPDWALLGVLSKDKVKRVREIAANYLRYRLAT